MSRFLLATCALLALSVTPLPARAGDELQAQAPGEAAELTGLWRATRRFGPDERGTLLIEHDASGWTADFSGRRLPVREQDNVLTFALPEGRGSFRARLTGTRGLARGQWFQPDSPVAPAFGTSIAFRQVGPNRWRGEVEPVDVSFTLYLMAERAADGTVRAFVRNPDRNIGHTLGVERLEREGNAVRLIGRRPGRNESGVVMSGAYDPDNEVLNLYLPLRGGSFDFRREGSGSDFYPRGQAPGRYRYRLPLARDDGWRVGTVEGADIDRVSIERFVQSVIEEPMIAADSPEIHAVLVARHGRLVLEEYFHGFDRDRLHDTRSASKSLTATLAGAVIQADPRVRLDLPVYQVMNGGRFPDGLEPRRRAMRLEHLLTMTSGIHCDDSDDAAPGNENGMLDQREEPDFYRFYMRAPMDRSPGERAIYCSGDPNLAIGVLNRATGEHPMDLFDRLLGEPLRMRRHAWYLSPSLQPYGGGSMQVRPRDFLKVGQLMLDDGRWGGRRILPEGFAARAGSNVCPLNRIGYGYLWWSINYPYKDRTVSAYFAGGNGGQGIVVVPELDLVIGVFAGNYASRTGLEIQQGIAPRWILPAVRERGDAAGPVSAPAAFQLSYAHERPAPACPGLAETGAR
ncbi:MAG TPA: serine hydrolase [Allosphingosinicella sp.]